MGNYRLHKDLGSTLKGVYTLILLAILIHFFGVSIVSDIIIAFISYAIAYPLTGLTLRTIGIWTRK